MAAALSARQQPLTEGKGMPILKSESTGRNACQRKIFLLYGTTRNIFQNTAEAIRSPSCCEAFPIQRQLPLAPCTLFRLQRLQLKFKEKMPFTYIYVNAIKLSHVKDVSIPCLLLCCLSSTSLKISSVLVNTLLEVLLLVASALVTTVRHRLACREE